jgi:hypothetical protein
MRFVSSRLAVLRRVLEMRIGAQRIPVWIESKKAGAALSDVTQASCLFRRAGILPVGETAGWEACVTCQAGSLSYLWLRLCRAVQSVVSVILALTRRPAFANQSSSRIAGLRRVERLRRGWQTQHYFGALISFQFS